MNGSVRAVCTAGVVALTGSALMVCPSVLPAKTEVSRSVIHTAGVTALTPPAEPRSAEEVKAALALVGQLARPADTDGTRVPDAALDDPAVLNTASTVIDDVYSVARYWANYAALELGPWLLGWVPLGYLISDQIYIWYPNAVLPTVDSFVYDFLDPVVNDALNPAVWLDGINAVVNTAANGIANGIADEINYVLSLGWFPIPLPPLPTPPLPRVAEMSTPVVTAAVSTETEVELDEAVTDTDVVDESVPPVSLEPATPAVPVEAEETEAETETEPLQDSESAAEDVEEATEESDGEEPQPVTDDEPASDDSDSASDDDSTETEGAEAEPAEKAEKPSADNSTADKGDSSSDTGSDD